MKLKQNINLAVDGIIFGYQDHTLFVLLIKQKYGSQKGKWALPGGFVLDEERLIDAVKREVKEETGVKVQYLEQLYTFGDDIDRDPRFRVVSVAYFGTVNPAHMVLKPTTDALEAQWYSIDKIPKLAFDHAEIIRVALERLRSKLNYQPIGFNLLDSKFPFSDLEQLYMTILDRSIDRRNFRKKILNLGFVEETDEYHKSGSGRPGKLFRFNAKKYKELEKKGISLEIKFA